MQPDLPLKTPEQLLVTGFHRRKGDRQARGAHARCGRVHQPAEAAHEAAIRPDHHLRAGRRQGHARAADHAQRNHATDTVQHLYDRRLAAGPDRESGPAPRSRRPRIRRARAKYILSPTAAAGHAFSENLEQHNAMSRNCVRWSIRRTTHRRLRLPRGLLRRGPAGTSASCSPAATTATGTAALGAATGASSGPDVAESAAPPRSVTRKRRSRCPHFPDPALWSGHRAA